MEAWDLYRGRINNMNIEKIRNAVNTLEDIENIKVVSNSFSDNDIDKAKYLRIPQTVS